MGLQMIKLILNGFEIGVRNARQADTAFWNQITTVEISFETLSGAFCSPGLSVCNRKGAAAVGGRARERGAMVTPRRMVEGLFLCGCKELKSQLRPQLKSRERPIAIADILPANPL